MKITKTTKKQALNQIRSSQPPKEELERIFAHLEALEQSYGDILPIGEKSPQTRPYQARSTKINREEEI